MNFADGLLELDRSRFGMPRHALRVPQQPAVLRDKIADERDFDAQQVTRACCPARTR
jgi:hypothetical protein